MSLRNTDTIEEIVDKIKSHYKVCLEEASINGLTGPREYLLECIYNAVQGYLCDSKEELFTLMSSTAKKIKINYTEKNKRVYLGYNVDIDPRDFPTDKDIRDYAETMA